MTCCWLAPEWVEGPDEALHLAESVTPTAGRALSAAVALHQRLTVGAGLVRRRPQGKASQ
jgi:hypothetical protein